MGAAVGEFVGVDVMGGTHLFKTHFGEVKPPCAAEHFDRTERFKPQIDGVVDGMVDGMVDGVGETSCVVPVV